MKNYEKICLYFCFCLISFLIIINTRDANVPNIISSIVSVRELFWEVKENKKSVVNSYISHIPADAAANKNAKNSWGFSLFSPPKRLYTSIPISVSISPDKKCRILSHIGIKSYRFAIFPRYIDKNTNIITRR